MKASKLAAKSTTLGAPPLDKTVQTHSKCGEKSDGCARFIYIHNFDLGNKYRALNTMMRRKHYISKLISSNKKMSGWL